MTSPTVTAVSELKPCPFCEAVPVIVSNLAAKIEHGSDCYLRRFIGSGQLWLGTDASKWNRRSALADVGEAYADGYRDGATGFIGDTETELDATARMKASEYTGKQPRPAAEECACGVGATDPWKHDRSCPLATVSPAAHTAQGEKVLDEVRSAYAVGYRAGQSVAVQYEQESLYAHSEARAIAYVDAREDRLRALATPAAQSDDVRDAMLCAASALDAGICHAYDVGNRELEARLRQHQNVLRRLAEQGSGAKDAKEGGK